MIECLYHLIDPDNPLPRQWLMPEEQQFLDGSSHKRQYEFCYGRALIRSHLCNRFKLPVTDIAISLPVSAAPCLSVAGHPCHLSISHSGMAIAIAISTEQPVGIDIERIRRRRHLADFLKQFGIFKGVPKSLDSFYEIWTAAEAYSKLSGAPLLKVLAEPLPDNLLRSYRQQDGLMFCLCHLLPAPVNWQQVLQLSDIAAHFSAPEQDGTAL